jgi:hypothetical protein
MSASAVLDSIKPVVQHLENVLPTSLQISSSTPPTPAETAQSFLDSIQSAFATQDVEGIVSHFTEDGWWRDILVSPLFFHVSFLSSGTDILLARLQTIDFDMNSLKKNEIAQHLKTYSVPSISSLTVVEPHKAKINEGAGWLEAFTTFETDEGRGKGFLRLQEVAPGQWKAFTFFVRPFSPFLSGSF